MTNEEARQIFESANRIIKATGRHKMFLSQYSESEMIYDIQNELFEIKYLLQRIEDNI